MVYTHVHAQRGRANKRTPGAMPGHLIYLWVYNVLALCRDALEPIADLCLCVWWEIWMTDILYVQPKLRETGVKLIRVKAEFDDQKARKSFTVSHLWKQEKCERCKLASFDERISQSLLPSLYSFFVNNNFPIPTCRVFLSSRLFALKHVARRAFKFK